VGARRPNGGGHFAPMAPGKKHRDAARPFAPSIRSSRTLPGIIRRVSPRRRLSFACRTTHRLRGLRESSKAAPIRTGELNSVEFPRRSVPAGTRRARRCHSGKGRGLVEIPGRGSGRASRTLSTFGDPARLSRCPAPQLLGLIATEGGGGLWQACRESPSCGALPGRMERGWGAGEGPRASATVVIGEQCRGHMKCRRAFKSIFSITLSSFLPPLAPPPSLLLFIAPSFQSFILYRLSLSSFSSFPFLPWLWIVETFPSSVFPLRSAEPHPLVGALEDRERPRKRNLETANLAPA